MDVEGPPHRCSGLATQTCRARQVDAEGQVRILGDLSPARGLARAELRHGSVVKEIEHDAHKAEEPVLGPNQLFLRKDRG